ncbi:MAG TPA: sugar phosphate isomerase/epimerase family protein [Chthonomonadales bacterium]|nr:sugar phosphate isomerase/epimerase family protein [Chthonomonadales bacterium]
MKKGICYGSLPQDWSDRDKLLLAKSAGFHGVEVTTLPDAKRCEEMADLAREIGIEIPSVMPSGAWEYPLSSPDESTRSKGKECLKEAIRTAAALKAATVLLVPGSLSSSQSYAQAYRSALEGVTEIARFAQEMDIQLAIENVWNRMLLSPKEMAEFVTATGCPNVGVYFDCGNIVAYGHPQSWIRELGPLIRKVHVKDFDSGSRQFRHLLQGSVPWTEIRTALLEIGYDDYLTAELPLYSSYPDQMVFDTSNQMDRIIAGH